MNGFLPALILAGGRSSRMGRDKALLEFDGRTMLAHIVRRLSPQVSEIALNAPLDFPDPHGLRLVPDVSLGQPGPLAGILSGLADLISRETGASHLVTVPSDSPFLPGDLADRLHEAVDGPETIAIARSGGRDHPVFGLWPAALAEDLEAWLIHSENRRLRSYLDRHRTVTVDFEFVGTSRGPVDPFFNVNTPEELEEARAFLEAMS